jgi:hypothetical protein
MSADLKSHVFPFFFTEVRIGQGEIEENDLSPTPSQPVEKAPQDGSHRFDQTGAASPQGCSSCQIGRQFKGVSEI